VLELVPDEDPVLAALDAAGVVVVVADPPACVVLVVPADAVPVAAPAVRVAAAPGISWASAMPTAALAPAATSTTAREARRTRRRAAALVRRWRWRWGDMGGSLQSVSLSSISSNDPCLGPAHVPAESLL